MRRLILSINVTLDGCCDHTQVIADDELHRYAAGLLDNSDGVLFGRVTYELFESYWPFVAAKASGASPEIDFAHKLSAKRKYVVSRTLEKTDWENSTLIKGDLFRGISAVKQEIGKDLVIFGSPGLASALAQLGLIDEYQFLVQPIVAGCGPTVFEGIRKRLDLRLIGSRCFDSGVVLLSYTSGAATAERI